LGIAHKFDLEAESILYANYDLLNDDPTYLRPGWRLTIPPTDGVYYKWKEGDTLQKVAEKYYVDVEDIIRWPSNHLDITQPSTEGLEYVMIPDGYREIKSWIVPLPYTSGSGATRTIAGPGGCASTSYAYIGSGSFIFPTSNTSLSGFDFSSYHLAIDSPQGPGTRSTPRTTALWSMPAGTIQVMATSSSLTTETDTKPYTLTFHRFTFTAGRASIRVRS